MRIESVSLFYSHNLVSERTTFEIRAVGGILSYLSFAENRNGIKFEPEENKERQESLKRLWKKKGQTSTRRVLGDSDR